MTCGFDSKSGSLWLFAIDHCELCVTKPTTDGSVLKSEVVVVVIQNCPLETARNPVRMNKTTTNDLQNGLHENEYYKVKVMCISMIQTVCMLIRT